MHRSVAALFSSAVVARGASSIASAADMPVKAPIYTPPVAAPSYSWTGCYVGVNAGYGWNRSRSRYTNDPNAADPIQGPGSVLPPSYGTNGSRGVVGGQAGCNWQTAQWIVGIEGDLDSVNLNRSAGFNGPASPNGTFINDAITLAAGSSFSANEKVSQHWLSTVRGRVGFAVTDRLMVFGTGGLAIGEVSATGSVTGTDAVGLAATWSGSTSTTMVGFAAGGGAEWALTNNWSLKGEYIYFDLGSLSHPLNLTSNTFIAIVPFPTLGNTTTHINGNIVRAGVNYKF
jgi:outer membrane immunogenic protein